MSKRRLEDIKNQLEKSNYYDDNSNGYWYNTINYLIEQAKLVEQLKAEIDNMKQELSLFKEKDKHFLIKSNIALNKKIEELENELESLSEAFKHHLEIALGAWERFEEADKQNERYRKAIDRFFYHYTNENIEDVQVVIRIVETFRKALEDSYDWKTIR